MTDVTELPTHELIHQANAYASRVLPLSVAGLTAWMLSNYSDNSDDRSARSMAIDVIDHAQALGWKLQLDEHDFWVAYHESAEVTTLVVRRLPGGACWGVYVDGAEPGMLSPNLGFVYERAVEIAATRPGPVRVAMDDLDSLPRRLGRRNAHQFVRRTDPGDGRYADACDGCGEIDSNPVHQ